MSLLDKSKALKNRRYSWEMEKFELFLYKIKSSIHRFFKRIFMLIDWYRNVLKDDCHYDGHSIFRLLSYKLEKLEIELVNGVAIHEKSVLKSLRLAKKLANRIYKDEYLDRSYRKHTAKWGELTTWYTPTSETKEYFSLHSKRTKANTEEEKKQEREDLMNMYKLCDELKNRDTDNLFEIMKKYINSWWD